MRTFTKRISAAFVLLSIVLAIPTYGQEVKVPDVHDGTWLLLRTEHYTVQLPTSATTQTIFILGTTRVWQLIGGTAQVTEVTSLQDPSQPILTVWKEESIEYYALLVDKELKIGTQWQVTVDNHPCPGLWTQAFVNVARAGPVQKWWTVRLTNPAVSLPTTPQPSLPGPSSLKMPKGT